MWERRLRAFVLLGVCAVALGGCSFGSMSLKSEKYFAVSNGTDTNYFRLRTFADTQLGVAEFRSGWYPTDAVDALFGDVSNEGAVAARDAQHKIEAEFADASVKLARRWTEAVSQTDDVNAEARAARLRPLMDARRELVLAPIPGSSEVAEDWGATTMEFDPTRNLWLRHADEKLVFVLSSNPDEVIGKISSFASDQETAVAVKRLGESLRAAVQDQLAIASQEAAVGKAAAGRLHAEVKGVADALGAIAITAGNGAAATQANAVAARDQLDALMARLRAAVRANRE